MIGGPTVFVDHRRTSPPLPPAYGDVGDGTPVKASVQLQQQTNLNKQR
jgi:hypothetical protein